MALLDLREIGLDIAAIALIKVDAIEIVRASEKLATFKESHHCLGARGPTTWSIM
jgi:hypothetical protein